MHLSLQEAERNRLCRRLQLKDIIPMEVQRFTKYPLLLENIAKYTGDGRSVHVDSEDVASWQEAHQRNTTRQRWSSCSCTLSSCLLCLCYCRTEDEEEREKVKRAEECCKKILNHVNQAVKEAENKQVKKFKSKSSHSQDLLFFFFLTKQLFNELCFLPKEVRGVSETAGRLVAQAERTPHDPGAEGKNLLTVPSH